MGIKHCTTALQLSRYVTGHGCTQCFAAGAGQHLLAIRFTHLYPVIEAGSCLQVMGDIADIDAKTAKLLATILQPFLSVSILLMIIRIVLSWYPQVSASCTLLALSIRLC